MEMYLLEQTSDLYHAYYDKLSHEVLHGGHVGLTEYMMTLEFMDDNVKKDWEKRLYAEMQELRMINEDIEALRTHLTEKENEIVIPKWIMDPLLREEAKQLLIFQEKYMTIDIRDTALVPSPAYKGPDFEERLREAFDVD